MTFQKPDNNVSGQTRLAINFLGKVLQLVILSVIVLTVLLSPVVIYFFTARFESKLPMCTASQPASVSWRCKIDQDGVSVIAGGNPEYCPEGKQHFVSRGWCNFNWDRPLTPAQSASE